MGSRARAIAILVLAVAVLAVVAAARPSSPSTQPEATTSASSSTSAFGLVSAAAADATATVGLGDLVPEIPPVDREMTADVFIWDTTTQSVGALRAIHKAGERYPARQVVIASSSPRVTAMPAQGLSVEDTYRYGGADITSGMWREFRQAVLAHYKVQGIRAIADGRLVVEPGVAQGVFRWFVDRNGDGRAGTTVMCAHLIDAQYGEEGGWALLKTATGERVRVRARVLIDGSVEGDLARRLGARYRYGASEQVFDASTGPPPLPRGDVPSTWIQRTSALLTLKVYSSKAPRVATLGLRGYDPSRYDPATARLNSRALAAFATCWSMSHVLPNGTRELNETWNDYPNDIALPHAYVFGYDDDPAIRARLRDQVLQYSIDRVRYLQENGYPRVGIARIPDRLYMREGLRVVGRDTYTAEDVRLGSVRQPVAFGLYALYDVHLPVTQDHAATFVHLPMGALLSADFDNLLIPGPVSTEHRAYNTAVRTEPLRANSGSAAGIIAAIAVARGVPASEVSYEEVRAELSRQGHRLGL